MPGHLFITRGDLQHLSCDAILVPSGVWNGQRGHVQGPWRPLTGATSEGFVSLPADDHDWAVLPVRDGLWPDPGVWLGHTGDLDRRPVDDAATLVAFIERAGAAVAQGLSTRPSRPSDGSDRPLGSDVPLLGVPVVGTGGTNRREIRGEVMATLVKALVSAVATADVDIVLVTREEGHYSAAQQARARYSGPQSDLGGELTDPLEALIAEARRERLVLFLGAGVSMGAGLPSWSALLDQLVQLAGLEHTLPPETRRGLDIRDVATLVKLALETKGRGLSEAVSDVMATRVSLAPDGAPRVSLVHQLLAALPVREAITTNYDTLFEQAWRDAGRHPAVLPGGAEVGREWLLKLHGSTENPEKIVLSRDDYLRFEGESSALAGMVQAMLLTRHLLFVGYSLSDDNFHRMVHQVRATAATRSAEPRRVGTVLTPAAPGVLAPIWKPEIDFVSTAAEDRPFDPRRQAIFLDCLAAAVSPPGAHLLDRTWSSVFSQAELALRDTVLDLLERAEDIGVREGLRREVHDAFHRFGGGGHV